MNGINAVMKETTESFFSLPSYKDRAKRPQSVNEEAGPHQTLNLPAP